MQTEGRSASDDAFAEMPRLLGNALELHQSGDLEGAYPLYREFLKNNPRHPMGLHLMGLWFSQRGDYQRAIVFMRQSLALFPEQPEVANNLGNAYSRSGSADEAIESYREAIRLYPKYVDALRNLGLCCLKTARYEESGESFRACLDLRPDDAAAWLGLGNLHMEQKELEPAIRCFEKALELRPDYADAHHNLGVCLRLTQRPRQALEHYGAAGRHGLDRAELHHNIGNALIDTRDAVGAIDAYRAALARNPLDVDSHRNLNSLLWQQEQLSEYLDSYRQALAREPRAIELRLAYATALTQQEDFASAEEALREGLRLAPESSALKSQLAYSLEGQGRWVEALDAHAATVRMAGSVPDHRVSYARALLACQRPDEAVIQAREGAAQMPFNQRALAYLGLCWRMLGDERDAALNDYEKLVRVFELPIPANYRNAGEFNARLRTLLDGLHIGKRHPPEQTLRGGSQTSGDLFDRADPEIGELVAGLRDCIADYIERFPRSAEHPLYTRRKETFDFSASWSVRLARCGYHTMHVHPLGWISSAYYVQVPGEIVGSDAHGGGLKFGEPDIDIGAQGAARRHIQPEIGRLVLFPSYMWHGTVPFESDEPRMTVAFDVVPGR